MKKRILLSPVWPSTLALILQCFTIVAQAPISISLISEVPAPFLTVPQTVVPDALGKPYYYLASKSGGLQVFDIQDITMPMLVKTIPQSQLNNLEVSDAFQHGNLLYLALGNFFGMNTQPPGLAILDVSDPQNPIIRDIWVSTNATKGSGFVTVLGDYAYLGAMTDGFFILDINVPDTIKLVSQTIPDPDFPIVDPTGPAEPRGRGMAIRGDTLFLCYDAGGLRVMDITDKQHPMEIGRYINPGNPGKQQAFNNIALHGNLAYLAVDYCGLDIVDIADLNNIDQVGWWNPWACESPNNIWIGSPGHTNQITYDSAEQLVFLSAGQSELQIVDVSVPDQPQLRGSYGAIDDNTAAWGMTLQGSRIYLTYILSVIPFSGNWAGVKILEWNSSSNAHEPKSPGIHLLHPNPFSEAFYVEVSLPESSVLSVNLIDAFGRLVTNIAAGEWPAGYQKFEWHGKLAPGLYFLRVQTPAGTVTKKLIKVP